MKIGITYDLKSAGPADPSIPDDLQEEFDSPHTIDAIAAVLRGLGHEVVLLGDGREFLEKTLCDLPDLVFNIAEGLGTSRSREARVPAVLEMLGIPYTGSDPLTMAVTLDKDCAKRLVAAAGVTVPRSWSVPPNDSARNNMSDHSRIRLPVVVKPAWEGSSKGIRNRCLVKSWDELPEVVDSLRRDHQQTILIEEFIPGDELTVGIHGNDPPRILGVMRIAPTFPVGEFLYSLEIKRDFRRLVKYECPPPLPQETLKKVEAAALTAYRVLGCRDIARVDFRLDREGNPFFLEVNPLPGLNPDDSDLVIMAGLLGWSYAQLIETIVTATMTRHKHLDARPLEPRSLDPRPREPRSVLARG
ncbi:MAG: D-alanine--D-alanine ligase [Planctomycetes bacterium]|nr:D-alanine--D-alanine ligase [Planctomycetota bacterium]